MMMIKDEDYLDFQSSANNSGLRVDEKLEEIIQYYMMIISRKELCKAQKDKIKFFGVMSSFCKRSVCKIVTVQCLENYSSGLEKY